MITDLTPEQWQQVYAARWQAIVTSTDPADRATTERIIGRWYERFGRRKPQFRWFDGWSLKAVASSLPHDDRIYAERSAELHDQLEEYLEKHLLALNFSKTRLYERPREHLGVLYTQLYRPLDRRLYDQLRGYLTDLRHQVLVGGRPGRRLSYWLAHYAIARQVTCASCRLILLDVESDAIVREWEQLQAALGWWFPFEDVCLCAERPAELHIDADKRLHCETGPALLCRNGFTVHAWHGTRVPVEWIEHPDELDPATALTWPHAEQRTAAAQIIGWDRVLEQLDPVVVDRDPNPMFGELLRVDLPGARGSQFLRARCGTGRVVVVPVPDTARTAVEAGALSYGLPVELYRQLEVRT